MPAFNRFRKRKRVQNGNSYAESGRSYVRNGNSYSRKPKRAKPAFTVIRNVVPDKQMIKLRYHELVTLNPAIGSTATNVFKANGMFDPNTTGAGHQPMGFDQFIGILYNHFTVVGSKITVAFASESTAAQTVVVGVALKSSPVVTAVSAGLLEQARTHWDYLSNLSSGRAIQNVSSTLSTKDFMGVKDPIDEQDLRGTAAADPVELAHYHVFAAPFDNVADIGEIHARVTIEYTAVLTERVSLPQS